jgi:transcriptional regulator GlxA family with amidase domain
MLDDRCMQESKVLVLLVYDDHQLLDFAGPAEVFSAANTVLGYGAYARVVVSPGGRPVRSSSGIEIGVDRSLGASAGSKPSVDTLMVVGGPGAVSIDDNTAAVIRALAERARRVTSVCTGALALASAGLLDGYRATTHWSHCDFFAERYPRVRVEPDQIYVRDGNRWTSAGVTAGIDLALALVEDDHGIEVAQTIARWLVVFTRRSGGQSQFSTQLRAQDARTPAVRAVQRWLPDHLAENLDIATLAARAGMSTRNFSRLFRAETGQTPAVFVESLRVEAARRLLETTDLTIDAVARAVGFKHAETLHRAIARRLATTPARYRQHFKAS